MEVDDVEATPKRLKCVEVEQQTCKQKSGQCRSRVRLSRGRRSLRFFPGPVIQEDVSKILKEGNADSQLIEQVHSMEDLKTKYERELKEWHLLEAETKSAISDKQRLLNEPIRENDIQIPLKEIQFLEQSPDYCKMTEDVCAMTSRAAETVLTALRNFDNRVDALYDVMTEEMRQKTATVVQRAVTL